VNELKTIAETLRDLLRSQIDGTSDYNFRLNEDQIVCNSVPMPQMDKFPYIFLAKWVESVDQSVLAAEYLVNIEITLLGVVKDADDAMGEVAKLQSDIDAAIRTDPFLTKDGSELVYGTSFTSTCISEEEFGFCEGKFTAKYHKT